MRSSPFRAVPALVGAALLAGCGGGSDLPTSPPSSQGPGGGPQTAPVPQFAPNPQIAPGPDDAAFSATKGDHTAITLVLRPEGSQLASSVTIKFATLDVTSGSTSGKLASDRTRIDFGTAGITALSDPIGLDYLRFFNSASQLGGDLGILGFLTPETAMPGGSASYLGRAEVFATDATRIYTLSGDAIVDADFAGQRVTVRFVRLEGQAQGLAGGGLAATQVPGGGEIRLSGAAITGATFSGGAPAVFGTPFAVEGALRDTGSTGGFFGPGADEAGGLVAIDDAGSLRIRGRYAAD